ncbi:MAG: hypothetical protein NVSMB32_17040 [Actinomycetota bacterium]
MPDASSLAVTNLLIGIDDTDNDRSRGTSALARRLLGAFDESRMGGPLGATRHQLLVDPRISATSNNISVCLALKASHKLDVQEFLDFVIPFVESEAAPGSNPGLALAREESWKDADIASSLVAFGKRAKSEMLDADSAMGLAADLGVHLSGHGGTNAGVIGALAALGLFISGSDGRFVWMPGIRELQGRVTYRQLRFVAPIDAAVGPDGSEPADEDMIDLGDWVRPVLMGGVSVLLLDTATTVTQAAGFGARPKPVTSWRVSAREVVDQH